VKSSLAQQLTAECLGTAFLLAAVVGSGIMAAKLAGGNGALALLCNTLPTGAILTVLILAFAPISGQSSSHNRIRVAPRNRTDRRKYLRRRSGGGWRSRRMARACHV
jgi:hypothetical protein